MIAPRAYDVAYVVYTAPDLDRMEAFLVDFGLARAARSEESLYMRAAGTAAYVHVTRRAPEARFVGVGVTLSARADLDFLAALRGSSAVAAVDAPGGGVRVRMVSPEGFEVDAVHGMQPVLRLPRRAPNPFNAGDLKARVNHVLRPKREPCPALRLGHVLLLVPDHDTSVQWWRERFGLVASDYVATPGPGGRIVGTFLRCDRGAEPVDHHSVFVREAERAGIDHVAFEVQDLDDLMGAHDFMQRRGYKHARGVGRHLFGSQIFDYWHDPFGFLVEHYTDGDVVDHNHVPTRFSGSREETTQWGRD